MRHDNFLLALTKSFMYILKNNGPNIDPCGIPILISMRSEFWFHNAYIVPYYNSYNEVPHMP